VAASGSERSHFLPGQHALSDPGSRESTRLLHRRWEYTYHLAIPTTTGEAGKCGYFTHHLIQKEFVAGIFIGVEGPPEPDRDHRPQPGLAIADADRNKGKREPGEHKTDDARMPRAHPVPAIGPFGKDNHSLSFLEEPDDCLHGSPALQGSLPVQGQSTEGGQIPSDKRIPEQLVFCHIIQGPRSSNTQQWDVLPALVLGEENKGALPGKVADPFHAKRKKRGQKNTSGCPGDPEHPFLPSESGFPGTSILRLRSRCLLLENLALIQR